MSRKRTSIWSLSPNLPEPSATETTVLVQGPARPEEMADSPTPAPPLKTRSGDKGPKEPPPSSPQRESPLPPTPSPAREPTTDETTTPVLTQEPVHPERDRPTTPTPTQEPLHPERGGSPTIDPPSPNNMPPLGLTVRGGRAQDVIPSIFSSSLPQEGRPTAPQAFRPTPTTPHPGSSMDFVVHGFH